jgi:hypothetical protein
MPLSIVEEIHFVLAENADIQKAIAVQNVGTRSRMDHAQNLGGSRYVALCMTMVIRKKAGEKPRSTP